jgi:hypothetical protein
MHRPLGWFRSNGSRLAWLAFFALACQFELTFGHVHRDSVGRVSAAPVISADTANSSADAQFLPKQKTPPALAQDFCAVCNSISLAHALVLPVSAATIPPISSIQDLHWPFVAVGLASRDHFHFNARAPPHA